MPPRLYSPAGIINSGYETEMFAEIFNSMKAEVAYNAYRD